MRLFVRGRLSVPRLALGFVLALTVANLAAADVIVLKSGRRIEAWNIEEKGDRIYYETPHGRLDIPRRVVERIERSGAGPRWSSDGNANPLPKLNLPAASDAEVARVVEGGQVNRQLLAEMERAARGSGSAAARERAAAAHALVAQHLYGRSDLQGAAESLQRALRFAPREPLLLLNAATLEAERQRFDAALGRLRTLRAQDEYLFEAYRLEGWIHYLRDDMVRAQRAWKKALAERSDAEVEGLLARAQQEAGAAEDFRGRASGRFLLRYDGGELASRRLATRILRFLDSDFDSMVSTFDFLPREPLVVILYPQETFYELTGVPLQVHGLFDGKIRVPVRGLVSLTPSLERVLRHELVHAFVHLKTRGRAPRWLHEGLAQWTAGQRPPVSAQAFRPLFEPRDGSALPRIEAGFAGDAMQVSSAYAAAWVVVDALEQRYGRGDMEEFLEALGSGGSQAAALRAAYRLTFTDLDREVYNRLR
ncbi:MAG: peptidase MA family metallohydrolase [Terriglobia bacterium]